MTESIDQYL